MDATFKKALTEYAAVFKEDPEGAEMVLEMYRDKFGEDFEKWAGAIRLMIKGMKIRKANPDMHIEDVIDRSMDA